MNEELKIKLQNLPSNPGIYQFFSDKGKVIYVGKAKNLKSRVKSYFNSGVTSPKTIAMVSRIKDLELIITDSEIEALMLENNLIKQFKPRYNVILKDDKTYPYIKVTNELFPQIYPTRNVIKDGSKYFGPYTNVGYMKSSLRMINQIFKIRSCTLDITEENIEKKKFKVCLDYHIKKCDGPCEGFISSSSYKEMVNEVNKLLSGKTDELIKDLKFKMNMSVSELEFEKAAELRDKIIKLESLSSKQKIVSNDFEDRDIIAAASEGKDAAASIFNIRNGKIVGKKQLNLSIDSAEDINEIYSAVIKYYYNELIEIPPEIIIENEPNDVEILTQWLSKGRSETLGKPKKCKIFVPQKGELKSLIKMCKENAILQLKEIQIQKMKKEGNVPYSLSALQRDLRLKKLPRKIECFDISNLQGTDTVASMVVFEDGKPKKSLYRKFIINSVDGPDDFASMKEVITRRYSYTTGEKENKKSFDINLPDLIMVDGGKGQLSSAIDALEELNINKYEIIGLAKRLEEVFFPNESEPANIPKTSSGLKLLQQIRDEAHRFAITFHRERRSKRTITSELNNIKGVGEQTINKLLKEFGSVKNLKETELIKIEESIGKQKAKIIFEYFNKNNS